MADTALQVVISPLFGVLLNNISSLIQGETGLIFSVNKQMEKLSRTLATIKDVLDDAEQKQHSNKAIQSWLIKLEDAAYEADDILDECKFEGLQLASEMRNIFNSTKQVTDFLKQIKLRHKIGRKIKELRERFDEIAEEKSKFHLQNEVVERRLESCHRETSSTLPEPQVYGRDEDKENLLMLLLDNANSHEDVSVYAVHGIGGLGKTTLVQLVYNDEKIAEVFTNRAWVYVSENFDVKRVTKAIIVSLSGKTCDLEELDPLQSRLQEELRGKKFLLVLDDVWNENLTEWNKLKCSFKSGAKGSSIIVTTRLETVAAITGTCPAYRLKVLSQDDCWSIFKHHAFGLGNEERPPLVEIGKEIVKKCGGVPMAAKFLGSLMRFKSEPNEWLLVRDCEIWDLPESNENNIMQALRLSYNHLPSYVRQCFAYCSIFPKAYVLHKEELIHLWMANGLLQSKGRELEDVGTEFFNTLLWRSFFQSIEKDEDNDTKTCKMHDLVHDLACHISTSECSVMDIGKVKTIARGTRHLSVDSSTGPSSLPQVEPILKNLPHLRSLVKLSALSTLDPHFIFSSLIRLRVLDLRDSSVIALPNSIGQMKHLRYLNVSGSCLMLLPESICYLRNLQILKLYGCHQLMMLPKNIRSLSSLRHLDIRRCNRLTNMPLGMGQLIFLRTLSLFIVGVESGCCIKELQGLNLEGELEIKGIERVKNSIDAKETDLARKQNLRFLQLTWSDPSLQENATEVIEGLQPHSNLRKLFIKQYEGVTFPSWLTVSSLPNLVEMSISRCTKCEHLPHLGALPYLKVLKIDSMNSVKFIHGESVLKVFPSLSFLQLGFMPNLEGWSSLLFPCLRKLILEECPKLTAILLSPSLRYISMTNCNEMILESLHNLPCLEYIEISEFEKVIRFPEGMLKDLPSLKTLGIIECDGLKWFPKVEMSSLESLRIFDCPDLEFMEDFQHLPVVRKVTLSGLHKLTSLPEGMKHAAMLEGLYIRRCYNLRAMPDWICSLTSLQYLYIRECDPDLERRCEKYKGEDWYKISHVPHITIGS